MSPQCSEDYRSRRPVSRSNTKRELSEEEKARKKRSYELWKIDRERDRLHEERKKRLIEEYNLNKRMSRHGRTGSQKEDNPRSPPDLAETRRDEEERRLQELRTITNELRQLVAQARTSTRGTDPAPALPPPRSVPRSARSPGRYDGDGALRRSTSHPRRTEGCSTSRNRTRSRSPRRSRSRQRPTEGRPTSRNRTRSRSPLRHDSRGDGPPRETSSYRTPSEAPGTSRGSIHSRSTQRLNASGDGSSHGTSSYLTRSRAPSTSSDSIHSRSTLVLGQNASGDGSSHGTSSYQTRSKAPSTSSDSIHSRSTLVLGQNASGDHRRHSEAPSTSRDTPRSRSTERQNSSGPGASTSRGDEERLARVKNDPEEYRLRRQLYNDIGRCPHTTDISLQLPCPLDSKYCTHLIGCACHRCPECQVPLSHARSCSRRRRSPPRTARAPRQLPPPSPPPVQPPEPRPVERPAPRPVQRPAPRSVPQPAPRPVPPQVPPANRRPPSPVEYPLPDYLHPLPPGRTYLYFPMGPLPAHYIATRTGSPLHNWWQRYRNTPFPGVPPIHIPFLQPHFTAEHIPPRPQNLGFGNIWVPPPRPPGPYYHGGPRAAYPWPNPNFRNY